VKHSEDQWLGLGIVTKVRGVHCMVQWTFEDRENFSDPGPTLEANSMLEIVNESR
jgi:hypothetical protein